MSPPEDGLFEWVREAVSTFINFNKRKFDIDSQDRVFELVFGDGLVNGVFKLSKKAL